MSQWHDKSTSDVLSEFSVDSVLGLSSDESKIRLIKHGPNISAKEEKTSVFAILLRQFKSFIIFVLIGAAVMSFFIGDHTEFIVITCIVLFIVLLSFFEEFKATKDMAALRNLTPKKARVVRDGKELDLLADEVVPGDIIIFSRGDIIPADARVVEAVNLQIDESALTGESVPVMKHNRQLAGGTVLAERLNMVYAGGQVTSGHGRCVVVATGRLTELGKIAFMVKEAGEELSPLQKRLDKLGRQFSYAVLAICLLIVVIGVLRGQPLENLLLLAVAVAVSGIPESLPAVIGVALAIGMKRMAKQNAIIKRLAAVETLGTCTVICTDKTGTLTQNKMVIEHIWAFDEEIHVTGTGFSPQGVFLREEEEVNPSEIKGVSKIIEIGVLCNNASLDNKEGEWHVEGESTEGALIVLAKKAGVNRDELHKIYPRLLEHPFDPDRKCMSSIHLVKKKSIVYSKGAPEKLLERCNYCLEKGVVKKLDKTKLASITNKNADYASKGFRVLGLAYKEHKHKNYDLKIVEDNLIFVGLVAIRDPPEPSALESIKSCEDAGIKVVMITGDNPITARVVAEELGILSVDQKIVTGEELDRMSDGEFQKIVDDVAVYARVTPKHKLRVVKALQAKGHIVAMTGDGVNDAPALKKADIGVAMGMCGTEVAKEASEMVIKDDNFSTIVSAVREGRTIYNNIQRFIYYLLPGNFSEVTLILIAAILGIVPPLTPLMILFINLVTSDIPALGLCMEKPPEDVMRQKPRNPKESILTNYLLLKISQIVPMIILGTIALFMWEITFKGADIATAQTVAFVTLIFFELFHVFNAKSFDSTIFSRSFFSNKILFIGYGLSVIATVLTIYWEPLSSIFGTVPLSFEQWISVLFMSSIVILFSEVQKSILAAEISERQKMEIHPTRR